jgi:hypothetical protein
MADVTKLLEQDHREVEDLFAKAESTSGAAKQKIVTKIALQLTIHAQVKEDFVYRRCATPDSPRPRARGRRRAPDGERPRIHPSRRSNVR